MKICISEATTLPYTFTEDVKAYADAGCPAMEVWLTKLESHLEQHGAGETRKLLGECSMTLAAAAYQGGLLLSQGQERKAHFDHFRRRLALCKEFEIPTLIVAADFVAELDSGAPARALVSLKQACRLAREFDVRLALEFRHSAKLCASLDTALALVRHSGEPNVGVNLDVFEYYTGPSKFEDLDVLASADLAHVQVADLAGVPRELAADCDRVFPGDGDFKLAMLVERLRAIGYQGWVSLELMNPVLWKNRASQVAELGVAALRRLIGHSG